MLPMAAAQAADLRGGPDSAACTMPSAGLVYDRHPGLSSSYYYGRGFI